MFSASDFVSSLLVFEVTKISFFKAVKEGEFAAVKAVCDTTQPTVSLNLIYVFGN